MIGETPAVQSRYVRVFAKCVTNTEMIPWNCAGDGGRSPGVGLQE